MKNDQDAAVASFETRRSAVGAVRALRQSGYAMERVSIVTRERACSARTLAEVRVGNGSWTGVFALPGLGPTLISGQLAEKFAGPLVGSLAGGSSSGEAALSRGLSRIGVPTRDAREMSSRVRQGECLVIVSGARRELRGAASVLARKRDTKELRAPAYVPHL